MPRSRRHNSLRRAAVHTVASVLRVESWPASDSDLDRGLLGRRKGRGPSGCSPGPMDHSLGHRPALARHRAPRRSYPACWSRRRASTSRVSPLRHRVHSVRSALTSQTRTGRGYNSATACSRRLPSTRRSHAARRTTAPSPDNRSAVRIRRTVAHSAGGPSQLGERSFRASRARRRAVATPVGGGSRIDDASLETRSLPARGLPVEHRVRL